MKKTKCAMPMTPKKMSKGKPAKAAKAEKNMVKKTTVAPTPPGFMSKAGAMKKAKGKH